MFNFASLLFCDLSNSLGITSYVLANFCCAGVKTLLTTGLHERPQKKIPPREKFLAER